MKRPASQHPSSRRRGNVIVFVAVTLPVLLGFASLTLDVGYMYGARACLQNAADAAALSGASALQLDPTEVHKRAQEIVALNTTACLPGVPTTTLPLT